MCVRHPAAGVTCAAAVSKQLCAPPPSKSPAPSLSASHSPATLDAFDRSIDGLPFRSFLTPDSMLPRLCTSPTSTRVAIRAPPSRMDATRVMFCLTDTLGPLITVTTARTLTPRLPCCKPHLWPNYRCASFSHNMEWMTAEALSFISSTLANSSTFFMYASHDHLASLATLTPATFTTHLTCHT
jgi:hypothetical protein